MIAEPNSSSVNVFKISQSQLDRRPIFFSDICFAYLLRLLLMMNLLPQLTNVFGDLKGRF